MAKKEELKQRIRIRIRAYDNKIVDSSARQIVETAQRQGAEVIGPIPLPTEIRKHTVNSSTFVHKNSRDQYEMRTHKRLIDIVNPSQKAIDALQNLNLPAGVFIEIKNVGGAKLNAPAKAGAFSLTLQEYEIYIRKKIGMTQVFKGDDIVPITLIESGPNFVVQIKTKEKDGYSAVQIGFGEKREKNIKKPQKGHLAKITNNELQITNSKKKTYLRWLREFRVDNSEAKVGDEIKPEIFVPGEKVTVVAISKGKVFQGVVKRHGFHGGPKSHGQKDRHRAPGSIGASWPQHVLKGMKMAGRMGGDRKTIKNLEIVEVDKENNLIAVKGAIPGRRGTLVMIKSS